MQHTYLSVITVPGESLVIIKDKCQISVLDVENNKMRKLVDSINQADMLRMFTMDIEKVEDESRSEG